MNIQTQGQNGKKAEAAAPVQDWENSDVRGQVLSSKQIYDDHVAKVTGLRQRQEAYEASLPKDPVEAMQDIYNSLKVPLDIAGPEYGPRAALEIMHRLASHGAFDDGEDLRDTLYWLAWQGLDGLKIIEDGARRASTIASQFNPRNGPFKA